jgi:ribosomal protein S6
MAIRTHILSTEFASDQQKLIIINNLRCRTSQVKQMRLRRLAHLIKAWRDSSSYRKYMMAQNVQIGHLRRSLNLRLTASVFQALRNHKEHEKHVLLQQNLQGDC